MNDYIISKITHPGLYSKFNYDKVATVKSNDMDLLIVADGVTKRLSDKRIEYLYKYYDKNFVEKLLYETLYIKRL